MVMHMLSSKFLHTARSLAFGHMTLGFWAYLSSGCLAGSVLWGLLSCCGRFCRDVCCIVLAVLFSCCGVFCWKDWCSSPIPIANCGAQPGCDTTLSDLLTQCKLATGCYLHTLPSPGGCADRGKLLLYSIHSSNVSGSFGPFHVVRYRVIRPCWSIFPSFLPPLGGPRGCFLIDISRYTINDQFILLHKQRRSAVASTYFLCCSLCLSRSQRVRAVST